MFRHSVNPDPITTADFGIAKANEVAFVGGIEAFWFWGLGRSRI